MKFLNLLLSLGLLSGCTTYSKCPSPPHIDKLELPISRLNKDSSNSETVKTTVESIKICKNYADNCYEDISAFN